MCAPYLSCHPPSRDEHLALVQLLSSSTPPVPLRKNLNIPGLLFLGLTGLLVFSVILWAARHFWPLPCTQCLITRPQTICVKVFAIINHLPMFTMIPIHSPLTKRLSIIPLCPGIQTGLLTLFRSHDSDSGGPHGICIHTGADILHKLRRRAWNNRR